MAVKIEDGMVESRYTISERSMRSAVLPRCKHCGSSALVEIKHPKLPNGMRDTLYRVSCVRIECGIHTPWCYPRREAVRRWMRDTSKED